MIAGFFGGVAGIMAALVLSVMAVDFGSDEGGGISLRRKMPKAVKIVLTAAGVEFLLSAIWANVWEMGCCARRR